MKLLMLCGFAMTASSLQPIAVPAVARRSASRPSTAVTRAFADDRERDEANREAAKERRLKRISPKVTERRELIMANQEMLKRSRLAEKVKTRGVRKVEKLPKVDERRLENLEVGQWVEGVVCRLVGHGAWVDVGAQTDGFLHVRAMKAEGFVHEPADEVSPGEKLKVCVKFVDVEAKKLGLSKLAVLPPAQRAHGSQPLAIHDLDEDAVVWGEVTRITHFGAFVDVGCGQTDAFLHVSDFPGRLMGEWAPDVFIRGQRLLCYVKEVDLEQNRVKLTAFRPRSLPTLPF